MTVNEGTLDRVIRVAVGATLLAGLFLGPRTTWGLVGILPLLTGLSGFCPAYTLFGISTCASRSRPARGTSSAPNLPYRSCSASSSGVVGRSIPDCTNQRRVSRADSSKGRMV